MASHQPAWGQRPGRPPKRGMPMSEQVSGTHGPAEDDAIKRQDCSELQAHGEEWPEPESSGEDEPEATWAPEGRFAGTRPGEDWGAIELRSHLDRTAFPAVRAQLLETLTAHQAAATAGPGVFAPGRRHVRQLGRTAPGAGTARRRAAGLRRSTAGRWAESRSSMPGGRCYCRGGAVPARTITGNAHAPTWARARGSGPLLSQRPSW